MGAGKEADCDSYQCFDLGNGRAVKRVGATDGDSEAQVSPFQVSCMIF